MKMTGMGRRTMWGGLGLVGVAVLVWTTAPEARTAGQAVSPDGAGAVAQSEETPGVVQPIGTMQTAPARKRTMAQMLRRDLEESTQWAPDAARARRTIPFRSPLDPDTYRALKAESVAKRALGPFGPAASREALLGRAEGLAPNAADEPQPLVPPVFTACGITGADQVGTIRPPDTHGAIGNTQFVEIVNSRLHVFNRFTCLPLLNVSLNAFFGIPAGQPILFDPRAVYDPNWNRWVLSAEQFPLSATDQRQIIAISTGPSALGPYFVYSIDVNFLPAPGSVDFLWDFPQLGMNQDAVIITANLFNPGFVGSATFAVAKALLYNGLGFSVPLFVLPAANPALVAPSLAPPIVIDQNANAILVSAAPVDTEIRRFTFVNPCCPPNQALLGPVSIPVAAYTVPANACQPGMADRLDTSDSRFVNASTQVGNLLYNVHTIALGPFPTPRWYKINTATNTALVSAFFFESGTSHDFNASIAANALGDAFVTWSTTECGSRFEGGHHARIRWSGDDAPATAIGPGFALFTSPVGYNPSSALNERWGDYSAVSLDPLNNRRAWIVNEKINAPAAWGSRFAGVGFVPF